MYSKPLYAGGNISTCQYPEIGGGHGRDGSNTDEQESEDSRAEKIMFNFSF